MGPSSCIDKDFKKGAKVVELQEFIGKEEFREKPKYKTDS